MKNTIALKGLLLLLAGMLLIPSCADKRDEEQQKIEILIKGFKTVKDKERKEAQAALVRIGKPAVEPLINLLEDRNWKISASAAEALGEIGDNRAIEPLLNAVRYGNPSLKSEAGFALGEIGDSRIVEPLIAILWKGVGIEKKKAAASALGGIGDKRAVEPLLAVLDDKHTLTDLRCSAALALGRIGDDRAVKVLIVVLECDEEWLWKWAAVALGTMEATSAVGPLIEALRLEKEYLTTNESIATALRKITNQDFGEDYDKWKAWFENKDK